MPPGYDKYSLTLNKLADPDAWDVRGVVRDVRQRLSDDGDLEAAAVMDYLTDRVNDQERDSVVHPADPTEGTCQGRSVCGGDHTGDGPMPNGEGTAAGRPPPEERGDG